MSSPTLSSTATTLYFLSVCPDHCYFHTLEHILFFYSRLIQSWKSDQSLSPVSWLSRLQCLVTFLYPLDPARSTVTSQSSAPSVSEGKGMFTVWYRIISQHQWNTWEGSWLLSWCLPSPLPYPHGQLAFKTLFCVIMCSSLVPVLLWNLTENAPGLATTAEWTS